MSALRVFVIAEAGVNHGGSVSEACKLIDAAVSSGADAVKFQTFDADDLATATAGKAPYQEVNVPDDASQREMLRQLQLSWEDHILLMDYCLEVGIEFMSTGFDPDDVDLLVDLGIRRIKIPSGELVNLPLLRHAAAQELPILLSTGMSSLSEIGEAVDVLLGAGARPELVTILHCVSSYPTPISEANLLAIRTIQERFGLRVGYSDHTLGIEAAVAATALGATVIEKHLTLDTQANGPDHKASLEPDQFRSMVAAVRLVELALGDGLKVPGASESANIPFVRRSIVASRPIRRGEQFNSENLGVKRPGTGLSPMLWDSVLGLVAPRDFETDEQIDLHPM